MTRIVKVCPACGSENVWKDAVAEWCTDTQRWVLAGVHDSEGCSDCDSEANDLCVDKPLTPQGVSELVDQIARMTTSDEDGAADFESVEALDQLIVKARALKKELES